MHHLQTLPLNLVAYRLINLAVSHPNSQLHSHLPFQLLNRRISQLLNPQRNHQVIRHHNHL